MGQKGVNATDEYVGRQVRMRRLMLEITQQKLAGLLGISFQQLQKYESGANRVSASRLQQLCHMLEVPISFFFEGAPGGEGRIARRAVAPVAAYVSDFLADADGLKLVRVFTQIGDPKLRRSLVHFVEELAGADDNG